MAKHHVTFETTGEPIQVTTGALLTEAAHIAGIEISQPCGGQGRCGRCAVKITGGDVRRRSTLRLSEEDVEKGYALACQAVVESDVAVDVPPQEKIERRLTTDRTMVEVAVPQGYDPDLHQTISRVRLSVAPPTMDDQTDDLARLKTSLRKTTGVEGLSVSLSLLRKLGGLLRQGDWRVTAVLDNAVHPPRLIDLIPGLLAADTPLWGVAIDIGTTTVSMWLVDLRTGEVHAQAAEYNGQVSRGEDVISRIIFASKNNGDKDMQQLVLGTIDKLLDRVCKRAKTDRNDVVKAVISGNSTMIHLLLGIPAESIRLAPFVTAVNHMPPLAAEEVGIKINPEAAVDCLPGVASYVGADITAGVLSSGVDDSGEISLFIDVGTNGEIVLGSEEWLVTCACSAGPAFEGAGVQDGMRATRGAIEEVWVNSRTYEPSIRVIGKKKPRGLCGSGLISLLGELFLTGVLDKGGNFNTSLGSPRVRQGRHGGEYVVVWGAETDHGRDIVLTHVDVDNLLRAKAAIYAGFTVLADSIGMPLEGVSRVLVGGAFGRYINVEKAIEIGLLPDMSWDRFQFLGNTSVKGAYLALLDKNARGRINDIAGRMTYIELSADNSFYEAFTSALFLPHTDLSRFPAVLEKINQLDLSKEAALLS